MKTLRSTGTTLLIAFAASTSLLAQVIGSNDQPDIDRTSYFQKSTILVMVPEYLDSASLNSQVKYQEWSKTFAVGMYPVTNSTKIRFNVHKNFGETVTVRLLDEKGLVLNQELLGKRMDKFGCYFNFSPSHDGTYTIEVANGQEVIRKTIRLDTPARRIMAIK